MKKTAITIETMNTLNDLRNQMLHGMTGKGQLEIFDVIVNQFGPYLILSKEELTSHTNTTKKHVMDLIVDKLKDRFPEDAIRQVITMIFGHLARTASSNYRKIIVSKAKNRTLDKSNRK